MWLKYALTGALLTAAPLQAAEDLDAALTELTTEVTSGFSGAPPPKIAIATMVHGDGTCSDFSERASDKFQGELFRSISGQSAVIDRRSLSAIFREQQLVEDGTISPSGAAKIAAVEQVDAIVTGKMTQYGDDLEIVVSVLDAVSGTVIGFADFEFRLSTRDEAMLAARSVERCGFVSAPVGAGDNRVRAGGGNGANSPAAEDGDNAVFTSGFFTAEVMSVFYARDTGKTTFTLRFTNTSDKELDLSFNSNIVSIQDNAGGVLKLEKGISGLAVCTNYNYCYRKNQGNVTSIASGNKAQLNFSATGRADLDDLRLSLSFELFVTSDPEKTAASRVVSVGFFDLAPKTR